MLVGLIGFPALLPPVVIEPEAEAGGNHVLVLEPIGGQRGGLDFDRLAGLHKEPARSRYPYDISWPSTSRALPAGCIDHAVQERNEQAVAAFGERLFAAVTLLPDQAVTEGQEHRQIGEAILKCRHDLATTKAGLLGVIGPGAPAAIALLSEIEELPLVCLGVEQDSLAAARPGELRPPARALLTTAE